MTNTPDTPIFSQTDLSFDGSAATYAIFAHQDDFELFNGTLQISFNAIDTAGLQTLLSKDATGYEDGGHLGIFLDGSDLLIRMQGADDETLLRVPDVIMAGTDHKLVLRFGEGGLVVHMDGRELASDPAWTGGLQGNAEPIVVGANQWASVPGSANNLSHGFQGSVHSVALFADTPQSGGSPSDTSTGNDDSDLLFADDHQYAFNGSIDRAVIIEHDERLEIDSGSLQLEFVAESLWGRQTLVSKDASGFGGGGHFGVYLVDNDLVVRLQDGVGQTELTIQNVVTRSQTHHLEVSFGEDGLQVYVDGVPVAEDLNWKHGLQGNSEPLVIGANQWASEAGQANNLLHAFNGTISELKLFGKPTPPETPAPEIHVQIGEDWTSFDGTVESAQVTAHSDALLLDDGTLSFAFKAGDLDGFQALFSKDSGGFDSGGHLGVFLDGNDLVVRFQGTATQTELTISDMTSVDEVHHIAISFGDTGLKIYLDGEELASDQNWVSGLQGNTEPVVLGANQWGSGDGQADSLSHAFNGEISAVSLFGQVLSETQIQSISQEFVGEPSDPVEPSPDPEPNPDPTEEGEALENFVLQGFNGDEVPQNGIGDYMSFYVGSSDNGPGFVEISDEGVLGNGLKATLQNETMQLQFNPRDEMSLKGFAREYGDTSHEEWQFDTYDRMRIWIKKPEHSKDGVSDIGAFNGDMQIGTYTKDAVGGPVTQDETDNGHFYHFFGAPNNGEWTQVILNMHPNHQRGLSGSLDHGNLTNPTGEEGFNYFDVLTRFYIDDRTYVEGGQPLEYYIDEIEFFKSPYAENDQQIYSIASNYASGINELTVTWSRHKDDTDISHEVRYSFQNIHETGWNSAFEAPGGVIEPQSYQGMAYQSDNLALGGQDVVFIAIKPENSDIFTQIEVALDPDGDGQANIADYLIAHRNGEVTESEEDGPELTGTQGSSDQFVFEMIDRGSIVSITNFESSEGDTIDLSALLAGFDESTQSIDEFVQFTHSSSSTLIAVDQNGGGDSFEAVAILNSVILDDVSNALADDFLII